MSGEKHDPYACQLKHMNLDVSADNTVYMDPKQKLKRHCPKACQWIKHEQIMSLYKTWTQDMLADKT